MSGTSTYISLYDQRVALVAHALTQNSKLSDKAATALAKHVLYAPEKVR